MNKLLSKIKRIASLLRATLPSALPLGMTEFQKWSDSIVDLYYFPMDVRSVKWALATIIMRLEPKDAYKSKLYFALCVKKGMAAQIASGFMFEAKQEQAREIAALEQAQKGAQHQAEVTATPAVANVQQ